MASADSNPPPVAGPSSPPRSRHRVWPWVAGACLVPFVALAVVVNNGVRLERSAACLRRQLMTASGGGWHTQVQLSVGSLLLSTVHTGLSFVDDVPVEAREILRAVRTASVGVYRRTPIDGGVHVSGAFWADADRSMARRGWMRAAGIVDGDTVVLVYVPAGRAGMEPSRACVAVCNRDTLVVVTAGFHPGMLAKSLAREVSGRWPRSL